jgi:hypothetical protein
MRTPQGGRQDRRSDQKTRPAAPSRGARFARVLHIAAKVTLTAAALPVQPYRAGNQAGRERRRSFAGTSLDEQDYVALDLFGGDLFICALLDGEQPAQAQLRRHNPGAPRNLNLDFARLLAA